MDNKEMIIFENISKDEMINVERLEFEVSTLESLFNNFMISTIEPPNKETLDNFLDSFVDRTGKLVQSKNDILIKLVGIDKFNEYANGCYNIIFDYNLNSIVISKKQCKIDTENKSCDC